MSPAINISSTPKLCVVWLIALPDGIGDLVDAAVHVGANGYNTAVRYTGVPAAAPGWTLVVSKGGVDQVGVEGQYLVCDCNSGVATIIDASAFAAGYGAGPGSSSLPPADMSAVNSAVSGLQAAVDQAQAESGPSS
jgi:hypothetical protein